MKVVTSLLPRLPSREKGLKCTPGWPQMCRALWKNDERKVKTGPDKAPVQRGYSKHTQVEMPL